MAGLISGFLIIILLLYLLPLIFWILRVVKLSKNKDKTGMWVALACGLILSPLIGWIVGLCFKVYDNEDSQEDKHFWCGVCDIKYKEEFLGGETARQGKVCRSCLRKIQEGESLNRSKETDREQPELFNQRSRQPEKTIWDQPKFFSRRDEERKKLLRKLSSR